MYRPTFDDIEHSINEQNFYSSSNPGFVSQTDFCDFIDKIDPHYDQINLAHTRTPPPEEVDGNFLSLDCDDDEVLNNNLAGIWDNDKLTFYDERINDGKNEASIPSLNVEYSNQYDHIETSNQYKHLGSSNQYDYLDSGNQYDHLESKFSKCSLTSPFYEQNSYADITYCSSYKEESNSSFATYDDDSYSRCGEDYGGGYLSPAPTCSSSSISSDPSSPKRRTRVSLEGLSEDEKRFRSRGQNNEASKKYRERKKMKYKEIEQELQQLLHRNQQLKEYEGKLSSQVQQCVKLKKHLEQLGYNF